MGASDNVHNNAQRMILLAPTVITTAAAGVTASPTVVSPKLAGMKYLVVSPQFTYGSGGTTVDVYIQTSIDGGLTWIDIMEFAFTTTTLKKVNSVSVYQTSASPYAPVTPSDGALTASTAVPGILGDRIRVKYTSVGTYAGSTTLAIYAIAKG